MTREKGRSITLSIAIIMLLIVTLMSSCGPAYHLRKAKHHWNKAIEKGATTTVDTTWQSIPVIVPEFTFETILKPDWHYHYIPTTDTLKREDPATGAKVSVKVDLNEGCPEDCIRKIYVKTEVPKDTVYADCPTAVHMEAKAGHTNWDMIVLAVLCLALGAILGRLFWR